jgi:hypothetical protein
MADEQVLVEEIVRAVNALNEVLERGWVEGALEVSLAYNKTYMSGSLRTCS